MVTAEDFEQMLHEAEERLETVKRLAAVPGPLLFADRWRPKHDAHLVCLDPASPTRWRATRFSSGDPTGHSEAPDFAGAIQAAIEHGADIRTVKRVSARDFN